MCRISSMSVEQMARRLQSELTAGFIVVMLSAIASHGGEARPGWQQEWDKTVQAAKAEGQVTIYVHSAYAPVLTSGAFEKAFPAIKLSIVSGVENDLDLTPGLVLCPRRRHEAGSHDQGGHTGNASGASDAPWIATHGRTPRKCK